MARKKVGGGEAGSWLNTYADLITLLMTFFVLLFSMSNTDNERMEAVMLSLRQAGIDTAILIPVDPNYIDPSDYIEVPEGFEIVDIMTMDNLYEVLSNFVEDSGMRDSMTVTKRGDLVHIQFNSSILFNADSYTMQPASRPLLTFVGEVLKLYDEKIRFINIGGHTARTGRVTSDVSDWRLSGERAATVAMFLEDEAGIDRSKMVTIGYGDNYPIADNDTEAGRGQNRRVELVVVGTESSASFDIYGVMSGAMQDSQGAATVDMVPEGLPGQSPAVDEVGEGLAPIAR